MSMSSEANLIPDRTVSIARGGSAVNTMEQQPSEDAIGSATDAGIKNVSYVCISLLYCNTILRASIVFILLV